jgi:YD repeat-containing protein
MARTATWHYTYPSGQTNVYDPLNHETTYRYDSSGRVIDIVDAAGNHHGTTWNANNNQTTLKSSSSHSLTFTYDQINNLTSIQNPALSNGNSGAKTTFSYGSSAHPYATTQRTDPAGNHVAFSYDTSGNLTSASASSSDDTAMGTISRTYQGDDNGSDGTVNCGAKSGEVCSTTDAKGNKTTYGYDNNGNVTSITYPGPIGQKRISYDALSRPTAITDSKGVQKSITYDALNRPKQVQYNRGGSTYGYTYDADGNLVAATDPSGKKLYSYNYQNRVVAIQYADVSKPAFHYTYDLAGNLTKAKSSAGTTTYTYTKANQVASVTRPNGGGTETFHYSNGHPTEIDLPGGIVETIGYDQAGRETSIKATKGTTTLTNYTATYTNTAGQDTELLQKETDHVRGITKKYTYDGLGRLVNVAATGANSYTYTYDKNGNRTKTTHNGTPGPTLSYNAAGELSTVNGNPSNATYDYAGNQTTTHNGLRLGYNAENQTTTFTPPGKLTQKAAYRGNRQTARTKLGKTTQTNGLLGLSSDSNGLITTSYTHLPTASHQVLGETIGTNAYYYLTDLHDSVVSVTNTKGTVKDTYTYSPYGQTLSHTGNLSNPYQYAGGYHDESTGLYHYGARYYNPASGR